MPRNEVPRERGAGAAVATGGPRPADGPAECSNMVPSRRFERPTCPLGGGRSIQLSYEGNGGILAWIGTPGRRGGVGQQASAC